jgi:hypothetical protein
VDSFPESEAGSAPFSSMNSTPADSKACLITSERARRCENSAALWGSNLSQAEAAFRIQKDQLNVRPIWHQREDRVQAHILVLPRLRAVEEPRDVAAARRSRKLTPHHPRRARAHSVADVGMEQATDPKPPRGRNERRRRGSTRAKLTINEECTVKLRTPPRGARFKGYTSFVVQELVLHSHVIDFQCERWLTADGKIIRRRCRRASMAISGRNCAVPCSPRIRKRPGILVLRTRPRLGAKPSCALRA